MITRVLVGGVLLGGSWYFLDHLFWGDVDYSKKPPGRLFRSIVGLDIPSSVTDLRIAGRTGTFGLKSWVWMRFRYGDKDLPALLEGKSRIAAAEGRRALNLTNMPMRHVQEDQRAVGWEDLAAIERPEFFGTAGGYPGSSFVWYGTLILDRKRKLIFVQVFGD